VQIDRRADHRPASSVSPITRPNRDISLAALAIHCRRSGIACRGAMAALISEQFFAAHWTLVLAIACQVPAPSGSWPLEVVGIIMPTTATRKARSASQHRCDAPPISFLPEIYLKPEMRPVRVAAPLRVPALIRELQSKFGLDGRNLCGSGDR